MREQQQQQKVSITKKQPPSWDKPGIMLFYCNPSGIVSLSSVIHLYCWRLLIIITIIIINEKVAKSVLLNGRGGGGAGSISYRTNIECLTNDGEIMPGKQKVVGRASSIELYSTRDSRAVVKLRFGEHNSPMIDYYYDAKVDALLQVHPRENICIRSNANDLRLRLFESSPLAGKLDEIYGAMCPDCMAESDDSSRHLIGTGRLLYIIDKLQRSNRLGRPIDLVASNQSTSLTHSRIFSLANLKVGDSSSSSSTIDLTVIYGAGHMQSPKSVRIMHKQTGNSSSSNTIVVEFYQFESLDGPANGHRSEQLDIIEHPFAFPAGIGCSKALSQTNNRHEISALQIELLSTSKYSLSLRDTDNPHERAAQSYAFDTHAKLIRRDSLVDNLQLTTIYDLRESTKYNIIRAPSDSARSNNGAKCVKSPIDVRYESSHKFINFESLTYLGRARVSSIEALVFEEASFGSSDLQFWVDPPVWVTNKLAEAAKLEPAAAASDSKTGSNGSGGGGGQQRLQANKIHGSIYVTYYFASAGGGGNRSFTGALLRVELTARDANSRLIWQKGLTVSEFLAGRLDSSELFSIVNICQLVGSKTGHMNSILESSVDARRLKDDESMRMVLEDPSHRNELLLEALNRDFGLTRTHVVSLSSRILSREPLAIELQLVAGAGGFDDATINEINCLYLGRGQLFDHSDRADVRNYTGVSTFEDCMWLARQHSLDIGSDEVLFVYTAERVECFVERLYKKSSSSSSTDGTDLKSGYSKQLNYFPYEFGNRRVFSIERTPAASRGQTTRPTDGGSISTSLQLFQAGSFKMMGKYLSLRMKSNEELRVKFSRVSLHGQLAGAAGEPLALVTAGRRVAGLTWSETPGSELIKLVGANYSISSAEFEIESQMSEPLCHSHCLLDMSCKSYSFCEPSTAAGRPPRREASCLLSSIDVGQPIVMQQLLSLKENLSKGSCGAAAGCSGERSRRSATIMFDEGNLQQPEVEISLDVACSISGKAYGELFKQTYPVSVQLESQDSVDTSVSSVDDCARKCFALNLGYLKRLASYKVGLSGSMQLVQDGSHESSWDSISAWTREQTRGLCISFLYADEMPTKRETNDNGHQAQPTTRGCLIASNSGQMNRSAAAWPVADGRKVDDETRATISMTMHKIIYSHLYRRIAGLRLARPMSEEANEMDASIGYKSLLEAHLSGVNHQIRVPMDDLDSCARACMLQIHGPRPICSSFDLVHDSTGSIVSKYCMLNSQSLHDIMYRGQPLEQQVVHEDGGGIKFWHFEPRESLLQARELRSNPSLSLPARAKHPPDGPHSEAGAFISISLVLKLAGLISGLWIGIKFTNFIIETTNEKLNELPSNPRGRTARLIHRLSGVSLSSNFRDVEVQM